MSLKLTLNQMISERAGGVLSLNEIEDFCHKAGYKLSNAERVLRPSQSPNIERVWKNNAIIGYKSAPSKAVLEFLRDWPSNPEHPELLNQLF